MNASDHVWVGGANAPKPVDSSLWLSTLTDIVAQWGWLFGLIAVGCLVTLIFGDGTPPKEH